MKWIVNGEEVELSSDSGVEIGRLPDRLSVRTKDGLKTAVAIKHGPKTLISFEGRIYEVEKPRPGAKASSAASTGDFSAPMPGLIIDVMVEQGQNVEKGQKVLILEAMKTQQPVVAPFDGVVAKLNVQKGQQVREGELMISFQPNDNAG